MTFNLVPDAQCQVSPNNSMFFYPFGLYDIAPGGVPLRGSDVAQSENCRSPYVVNLLVNSYLRPNADTMLGRAEPNILQLHSAEVKLMTIDRQRIEFNRDDVVLPNPFLVTTNNSLFPSTGTTPSRGIAAVEAIPVDYGEQLDNFVGGQILAEIQIFGTTTGDVDIEFKPFVYPIEICYGCAKRCDSDIDDDATEEEIFGMGCRDNSGNDGRICIDPTC